MAVVTVTGGDSINLDDEVDRLCAEWRNIGRQTMEDALRYTGEQRATLWERGSTLLVCAGWLTVQKGICDRVNTATLKDLQG